MLTAVEIVGLTVRRKGVEVLSDISASFKVGTVTGLIGPSGSGKSTLLRCLVGVQRFESGTLTILGHPSGTAELRGNIGYLSQNLAVYNDLTVAENVKYFASLYSSTKSDVTRVLGEVDMTDFAGKRVDQLSGGQKARVSLAVALVGNPKLLILDEPTVGLDPLLREDLWSLFNDLAASDRTLIISSHVMDEAERCQYLVLLREGKVLTQGTPAEIRARTNSPTLDSAFLALIKKERR